MKCICGVEVLLDLWMSSFGDDVILHLSAEIEIELATVD